MKFNPNNRHRHSHRLQEYDYSEAGAYFVTICARDRECLFGEVVGGEMRMNECGRIVQEEWERTAIVRPNVELDEFIVMPNHFHAILIILDRRGMAVTCLQSTNNLVPKSGNKSFPRKGMSPPCPYNQFGKPVPGSLGTILGHFKSISTKRINRLRRTPHLPIWQRNYYEHIIRNDDSLNRIRQYIQENSQKWEFDHENPNVSVGAGLVSAHPWEPKFECRGTAVTCPSDDQEVSL